MDFSLSLDECGDSSRRKTNLFRFHGQSSFASRARGYYVIWNTNERARGEIVPQRCDCLQSPHK